MQGTIGITIATPFDDYELIDSGDGAKFERFGNYKVVRPDPRVLWHPTLSEKEWAKADASFKRTDPTSGDWTLLRQPPKPWHISFGDLKFSLKPTSFKHVGLFPEQAANWTWVQELIKGKSCSVLNLFAYTGAATLSAASVGAKVTHVDATKTVIQWARDNAKLSKLEEAPIRWIEDDVMKFIQRDIRRNAKYEGIIMDPPRFGRGSNGEVWKLDENLTPLIETAAQLLSDNAEFFLVNAYTADISSLVLLNILQGVFAGRGGTVSVSELVVQESAGKRFLPNGIIGRWQR